MKMETATFAAGCFWGVEEAFRKLDGVLSTQVGYMGGTTDRPSYEDVCTGLTGHAEAVQMEFDPEKISYRDLLKTFWEVHDPTQHNRQGPDVGSQYRSAIFYHNREQKRDAEGSMRSLHSSGKYRKPIVTQIVPATSFWRAEEHHQQYVAKTGKKVCH